MKCEQAVERIHQILDGDLMDASDRQEMEEHLASCDGCRKAEAELRTIQQSLRALPADSLPDDVLDAVWTSTTKSHGRRLYQWGLAAAAAVLVVSLLGLWQFGPPGAVEPTQAELDRATEEARMVFGLTAQALRKTERAAFKSILAEEVSPALRSVPIKWPGSSTGRRKNRDEI
jgi:anti-sigma factor RsiW